MLIYTSQPHYIPHWLHYDDRARIRNDTENEIPPNIKYGQWYREWLYESNGNEEESVLSSPSNNELKNKQDSNLLILLGLGWYIITDILHSRDNNDLALVHDDQILSSEA